ncbi:purine-nucleoside phosphorylase [Neobittarella massiliensis]|uniref:Purine nucleoside phosphorylase DeoD-type n=2 Tax=Oscillospiraceae TaxID=216572 RepID=A0A8J6LZD0_9FIRM|nr:purine-nucleoside phosphorylase [Neobittarella massiliensis]MBC3516692.1 purine-nucleoside phosphorylase [Neobittarella massiliensis]SCJ77902.1 Purine nucleoside phosphorylase deoD-type [uncultured Anaerotruncus sp.]
MSFHIGAKEGQIASRILLPGDPMRAKYIAEKFLEGAECVNKVRGAYAYTGKYKGKDVTVMGTGMGMPQVSIYFTELARDYGTKTMIRIGTCGGLQPDMKLLDVVLGTGACTTSGMNRRIFPGEYAPIADFELLNRAYEIAGERNIPVKTGLINSIDSFYRDKSEKDKVWTQYGVIAGEMEGAALYTIAARYGARALTMLSVSDGPYIDTILSYEEKEQGLNNMIQIALDTAIEF